MRFLVVAMVIMAVIIVSMLFISVTMMSVSFERFEIFDLLECHQTTWSVSNAS